jgi:hypothetical protein
MLTIYGKGSANHTAYFAQVHESHESTRIYKEFRVGVARPCGAGDFVFTGPDHLQTDATEAP